MSKVLWTETVLKKIVIPTLGRYPKDNYGEALLELSHELHMPVSSDSLNAAFRRNGMNSPSSYCRKESIAPPKKVTEIDADIEALISAVKGEPLSLEELCNELDMAPGKVKELVDRAAKAGHFVRVAHDSIGFNRPGPKEHIQESGIAPVSGKPILVGSISDTHLGSKWAMRKELQDFIDYAYDLGVREFLHSGDLLDGIYRHSLYEQTHIGAAAQTEDALETLPQKKGLTYHFIDGNHDETITDAIGMQCGQMVMDRFAKYGRKDLRYYGPRKAFIKIRGIVFELWHPGSMSIRKPAAYATSYVIQTHIREMYVGMKPDVLLIGHYHRDAYTEERAVHGLLVPCFQSPGSIYSKTLNGACSMGGLILTINTTDNKTVRRFGYERTNYFLQERPQEIDLSE